MGMGKLYLHLDINKGVSPKVLAGILSPSWMASWSVCAKQAACCMPNSHAETLMLDVLSLIRQVIFLKKKNEENYIPLHSMQ